MTAKRALVIGGGVSGMTAALGLANQGFEVVIVEKERHLGGLSRQLTRTIEGDDIQEFLASLVENISHHETISAGSAQRFLITETSAQWKG